MYKKLIISILSYIVVQNLSAQNYNGAETVLGVKGGLTFSKVAFFPIVKNQKLLAGYNFGALFRYSGEKYLAMQIEVNYLQGGFKQKNNFYRQFSYIQVPLLAHVFVGKKNFRIFVNLGPDAAYMINEKNAISLDSTDIVEKIKYRFDYGLLFGLGFELHSKAGIFQLEGRYNLSFGDIFENTLSSTYRESPGRNIVVTFGYLFDIKHKTKKPKSKI